MDNLAATSPNGDEWIDCHSHRFDEPKPIELDDKQYMPGVFLPGVGENWPYVEIGGEG